MFSWKFLKFWGKKETALQNFYREYWEWVEAGAPEGKMFYRHCGLCSNLDDWSSDTIGLFREMRKEFIEAGLSFPYPFGESDYFVRQKNRTQHQCPKRLAWVKKHLKG